MNILENILNHKSKEVLQRQEAFPMSKLKEMPLYSRPVISFKKHLLRERCSGIIAEFKTRSPSRGIINAKADAVTVTSAYADAGAAALSVLTDNNFFGGSLQDLIRVRQTNALPLLRKDFILSEYQLFEAKACGADAVLLIAAALTKNQILELAASAKKMGLEVLFEIHREAELEKLNEYIDLVGVNNRDLQTFKVSIENSVRLSKSIPDDFVKISESGIKHPENIAELRAHGYKGFLTGQLFMQNQNPGRACQAFINNLRNYKPINKNKDYEN